MQSSFEAGTVVRKRRANSIVASGASVHAQQRSTMAFGKCFATAISSSWCGQAACISTNVVDGCRSSSGTTSRTCCPIQRICGRRLPAR